MRFTYFLLAAAVACGQPPASTLGAGPWTFTTYEKNQKIQVSAVVRGLSHPWSLAFLPDGDMLITERPGRLRLVHNGVVAPEPIPGISGLSIDLLFDIALHPDFAANGFVYLTYIKKGKSPQGGNGYWATTALARGRFDGKALNDVKDLFVADAWEPLNGGDGSRVVFGPDGKVYFSSSHRRNPDAPQDLSSDVGKILRLNDDGTIPKDNPFVGQAGRKPEIFSLGHRTVLGLTFKPGTSELWETERPGWTGETEKPHLDGELAVRQSLRNLQLERSPNWRYGNACGRLRSRRMAQFAAKAAVVSTRVAKSFDEKQRNFTLYWTASSPVGSKSVGHIAMLPDPTSRQVWPISPPNHLLC